MGLWLQYHGHVEHLRPAWLASATFLRADSLLLNDASFLTLTARGQSFASAFLAAICCPKDDREFHEARDALWCGELKPRYDDSEGIFSWGCHLLKHFRQPAWKQRLILTAAEELAWPAWFDDPLPLTPGINPKTRLHDAIKDLNRRQEHPLIHFKGDGTGRRIGWDLR